MPRRIWLTVLGITIAAGLDNLNSQTWRCDRRCRYLLSMRKYRSILIQLPLFRDASDAPAVAAGAPKAGGRRHANLRLRRRFVPGRLRRRKRRRPSPTFEAVRFGH
jgi:hypothetical protein